MDIKIIKRDGSTEPFQPDKIFRVVQAAGLNEDQAKSVADQVTQWINAQNTDRVTSAAIRDKVVELLDQTDKYAHDLFVWYDSVKHKPPA